MHLHKKEVMRTLHKLFNENLIRNWVGLVLVSLLGGVLLTKGIQKQVDNETTENFLSMVGFAMSIGAPFMIFFLNLYFVRNVKLFINRSFSKTELVKFYFLNQLLKVSLFLVNLIILYLVFFVFRGKVDAADTFKFMSGLGLDVISAYYYYYLLMGGFFIFFSMNLYGVFTRNVEISHNPGQIISKKQKTKNIIYIFFGVFFLAADFTIPEVFYGILILWGMNWTSVRVFNRNFEIFKKRTLDILSIAVATLSIVPVIAMLTIMTSRVHDSSVLLKDRVEMALLLENLHTDYSSAEQISFLTTAEIGSYKDLLAIFDGRIKLDDALSSIDTDKRAYKFLQYYKNHKMKQDDIVHIIRFMNDFSIAHSLGHDFNTKSCYYYKSFKVNKEVVKEFSNSDKEYFQLASLVLGFNSLNSKEYLELYESKVGVYNDRILKHRFVISMINKLKKKLGNKKDKINRETFTH